MAKEARYTWSFTGNSSAGSTNVGQKFDLDGMGLEHAWYLRSSSNCTATVTIYSAESTTAGGISLLATTLTTNAASLVQYTGAFLAVWPAVQLSSASTSVVTVNLISMGGAL